MEIILSFLFLTLAMLIYVREKNWLNPGFITCIVWGILLIFYKILPHNLYDLQYHFLLSIFLWVIFFLMGSLIPSSTSVNKIELYNNRIFNIYFYLLLIFGPLALVTLVSEALKVGPEFFFLRLRVINAGLEENDTFSLGPLGYVFNFSTIVCLLFTYYFEKISKYKYWITVLIVILLGVVTLARTALITLLISVIVLLSFKLKISRKYYIYFLFAFIIILFGLTNLREQHIAHKSSFMDNLYAYIFASMPAYDTIKENTSHHFGPHTFRFFYALLDALGIESDIKPTIQPYVYIPIPINVYTVMFTFFKDFGYLGISVASFIYGMFFKILYKRALQKKALFILLYSVFFPSLILQFFSEYILQNLSTYLQFTIYLFIPLLFKRKS